MKISFTTICMDRLFHLKETLPQNIEDTSEIDREFIILNYNSKDSMNEWLWNHYQAEIKSGLIKLYHTEDPKYFDMSHSKNVVAKQATGDIIVNADADNYIVKGFPEWLIKVFSKNPNSICRLNTEELKNGWSGAGKIAISKWNLLKLKGYDEGMTGWGYEDIDLLRRAKEYLDLEYVPISLEFIDVIEHSNSLRFENYEKDVLDVKAKKITASQIVGFHNITAKKFRMMYDGTKDFEQPEFDYWNFNWKPQLAKNRKAYKFFFEELGRDKESTEKFDYPVEAERTIFINWITRANSNKEKTLRIKEAIKKLERKEKLQYNGWAEDLNDETYKYKGLTWGKTPEAITYFESADWEAGVPFYDLNYIGDDVFYEHHKYPNHKRKLNQEDINPKGWGECTLIRKFV